MHRPRDRRRSGFTIIELLIVVIVIGVLAAAGLAKYQNFAERARTRACVSNQTEIGNAFSVYFTQYRGVPSDGIGWSQIEPSRAYTWTIQGTYPWGGGWDHGEIRNMMGDKKGFICPGSLSVYYGGDIGAFPNNQQSGAGRRWGYGHSYKGQDTGGNPWPRAWQGDTYFPYAHDFVYCSEWGVPGDAGPDQSGRSRHSARW